jgi:aldose 1-epimerase
MQPAQQFCYTDPKGKDIYLFTLRNSKGTEIIVSNYGAIVTSFKIKNADGSYNDIVLGFDDMRDYLNEDYLAQYPWFGCAVGRYANRIRNAAFVLDGKKHELSKNRGEHQLHGGFEGFDKKIWTLENFGENPYPFIELSYLSKDGEEGYPGNLEAILRYELNDENEFSYEFNAVTDQSTPVNLTHHGYFNLHKGEGTVHDHELKILSSRVMEQDADIVATGNLLSVDKTAYDFRTFKKIGEGLKQLPEYDTSFVIDKAGKTPHPTFVAELKSGKLAMEIWSTEPVVHFYSGKWTPEVKGKNGMNYGPFSGLCLETHIHPDAVNNPQFPNTILNPGETYFQKTIYKIR